MGLKFITSMSLWVINHWIDMLEMDGRLRERTETPIQIKIVFENLDHNLQTWYISKETRNIYEEV